MLEEGASCFLAKIFHSSKQRYATLNNIMLLTEKRRCYLLCYMGKHLIDYSIQGTPLHTSVQGSGTERTGISGLLLHLFLGGVPGEHS